MLEKASDLEEHSRPQMNEIVTSSTDGGADRPTVNKPNYISMSLIISMSRRSVSLIKSRRMLRLEIYCILSEFLFPFYGEGSGVSEN